MNQILTDAEITLIIRECARGSAINRDGSTSHRIARAIEQAILNKLSAQEPVAWFDEKLGCFDEKHFDQLYPLYLHPAPNVPEGYVLVPVEPSVDQIVDGQDAGSIENSKRVVRIYKAMLAASRSE